MRRKVFLATKINADGSIIEDVIFEEDVKAAEGVGYKCVEMVPKTEDVTSILVGHSPGDGDGLEIYAKSSEDIYSVFDRLSDKIEELEAECARLRKDAQRYLLVKTMTKEQLLFSRGAYGMSDEAIDAALAAKGGE